MALIDMINAPWALTREAHGEMLDIYETHLKGEKIDIAAIEARIGKPLNNAPKGYFTTDSGVAVLSIEGLISKKMNLLTQVSGGTSLDLLANDFQAALADPAAHSIVLLIDSPGGATMGLQEVGDMIFAARGQKPIVALTDGMMCSAAYWLGSAADAAYISSDTTMVGSIGVIYQHVDRSGADAKAGLKRTSIYAGQYKTLASDSAPLSDAAKTELQAMVDTLYSLFVNTVARNRGVDAHTVLNDMADAKVFLGRDAVKAGLVDGVSTLSSLVGRLAAGTLGTPRNRIPAGVAAAGADPSGAGDAPEASAAPTPTNHEEIDMTITKDFILANHPDIAEALRSEGFALGRAEGMSAGASAERERIQSVEAQSMPGHDALIQGLKFDGKTTGPEAAVQVLSAEKTKNAGVLAQLRADAPAPAPAAASATGDPGAVAAAAEAALPLEARAKAQFERDPKLQAEFQTVERYTGFLKHEEKRKAA